MKLNGKKIFKWAKIIIIIYGAIGTALFYLQDTFLFHPKKLPAWHVFSFDIPFRELQVPFNKEDTMSLIQFSPTTGERKGIVIYFHGNQDNVERYAPFAKNFTSKGYEVWMPDYPGFGKSTGERDEKKLYEQAYQVMRMASGKYQSDSIVIYGKSFGTGIAAYVASTSNPGQLVLETPYYSIPDLYRQYTFIYPTEYLSDYKIPTGTFLEDVKAPVTIFHGTGDGVIPYRCAAKLKSKLKPGDRFITIKDGAHNNLAGFAIYKQVLDSLLR
jgi:alpha-beta hydrolase superfamily lysophospholipase